MEQIACAINIFTFALQSACKPDALYAGGDASSSASSSASLLQGVTLADPATAADTPVDDSQIPQADETFDTAPSRGGLSNVS